MVDRIFDDEDAAHLVQLTAHLYREGDERVRVVDRSLLLSSQPGPAEDVRAVADGPCAAVV